MPNTFVDRYRAIIIQRQLPPDVVRDTRTFAFGSDFRPKIARLENSWGQGGGSRGVRADLQARLNARRLLP